MNDLCVILVDRCTVSVIGEKSMTIAIFSRIGWDPESKFMSASTLHGLKSNSDVNNHAVDTVKLQVMQGAWRTR
jgi:hypothetical protein